MTGWESKHYARAVGDSIAARMQTMTRRKWGVRVGRLDNRRWRWWIVSGPVLIRRSPCGKKYQVAYLRGGAYHAEVASTPETALKKIIRALKRGIKNAALAVEALEPLPAKPKRKKA